ncbi:hypothetical protein BON30_24655 [Cystobacter ferrugineus]|uniref:Uncharacterized protein n=1 Tax=Cystobacter ferrugineus TaxID=83449 RepID=A0A1L9B7U6_9BACT|nr:hypothetical protein BON30_24655 [Cystobacter ferrugineus]
MRGPEVGVDAKAWGRGLDRGAGALAQAVSSNSSALQVSKRIDTSFHQAWVPRAWPDLLCSMPARAHGDVARNMPASGDPARGASVCATGARRQELTYLGLTPAAWPRRSTPGPALRGEKF